MSAAIYLRKICAIAIAGWLAALCAAAQQSKTTPAATPTVDQIIDHYVAAIGGRAAIEKLTTRASMGTIEVPAMQLSGTVLIHEKAPDKILQVVLIHGNAFRQGFDGKTGWSDDPADGTRVLEGVALDESRRDADFFHPLHLHEIYPKLTFAGQEKIADRDAYVLEGTSEGEAEPDKMYFDVQSGLAVRIVSHRHTPDGEANLQEDFQDYRPVDGIELPFTIIQSGGSSDFTIHIGEIHHGVSLDDSEFAPPKPEQPGVQ
jgi:zinc protease